MDDHEHDHEQGDKAPIGVMPKNRVEALVDGIFGVAMTLLVLDVKIPQGLGRLTDEQIIARLIDLSANFRIYFISFVMLGLFWIGHHVEFHFVRNVDRRLLWINLVLLFGVTMVPFSTSLLGEYGDVRTPAIVYGINLILVASMYWLQLEYLQRHPHLASGALTRTAALRFKRRAIIFLLVPALSIVVAFFLPSLAGHLYFIVIVLAIVQSRIDKLTRPID